MSRRRRRTRSGRCRASPRLRSRLKARRLATRLRTRTAEDAIVDPCVDPSLSFTLSESELALSKREVGCVRRACMSPTSDLRRLRKVLGDPSFDAGTKVVPTLLGRNPDELENSEDCRSAGGHGNQ